MTTALQFIEKAKTNLGGGNCKIYYLEILIRNDIFKSNKEQYNELQKAIVAFQTSRNFDTFNSEKILEVLQLKLLISKEHEKHKYSDSNQLEKEKDLDEKFSHIGFEGWLLNVRFDELKVMKSTHPFFMSKISSYTCLNSREKTGRD